MAARFDGNVILQLIVITLFVHGSNVTRLHVEDAQYYQYKTIKPDKVGNRHCNQ